MSLGKYGRGCGDECREVHTNERNLFHIPEQIVLSCREFRCLGKIIFPKMNRVNKTEDRKRGWKMSDK